MRARALITFRSIVIAAVLIAARNGPAAPRPVAGTTDDPIIDSAMSEDQAFDGLSPDCPANVRRQQALLTVTYYSFDHKVHRGQLVIDRDAEADVQRAFRVMLAEKFPIQSVIPMSDARFRKAGKWDDDLSMIANNTSGFNYRQVTGGTKLSKHALGRAIDINPVQNPYVRGRTVLPPGAKYDPQAAGTLTAGHAVTRAFVDAGWTWGGSWSSLKDYQHFEKLPKK
jgi:peptidoglycan L-alanyl-D-glutamate endopeptidase CwlK